MRRYTVDELYSRRLPCGRYSRKQIEEIAGEGLTAQEIAALDIPAEDRMWVVAMLLCSHRDLARRIARDVIHLWPAAPPVAHEYLETGEEFLRAAVMREVDGAWTASIAARSVVQCVTGMCEPDLLYASQYAARAWFWYKRVRCENDLKECIAIKIKAQSLYLQWAMEALEAEEEQA